MDVLLVVDMQEGLLSGGPKHDLLAVVERINRLALRVRQSRGSVFFVQHAGPVGDEFEPLTPGWQLLSTIKTEPCDRVVSKTLNDPFFKTHGERQTASQCGQGHQPSSLGLGQPPRATPCEDRSGGGGLGLLTSSEGRALPPTGRCSRTDGSVAALPLRPPLNGSIVRRPGGEAQ